MAETDTSVKVRLLTFNTWGLKYVSKFRKERLRAIADKLAGNSKAVALSGADRLKAGTANGHSDDSSDCIETDEYDVVALQEIWCQEDWDYIVDTCKAAYPYYRLFYSGILAGPGLAILSKIPIESTFLYRFPINGRPSAFFRGDWYVGKSISVTLLKPVGSHSSPLAILNSHMHAPYALTGDAAYHCHRSCQAWDFSKLANLYKKAGYAVVIVGDLNSRPGSLPHKFLTMETGLVDSWEQLHGQQDLQYIARLSPMEQIRHGGTTCDSILNTWRAMRRPDEACRLDYALVDPARLQTVAASVRFTERIPDVGSFSDHFAYSCTLRLLPRDEQRAVGDGDRDRDRDLLLGKFANYEEMLGVIAHYNGTARWQRLWRGSHFWLSVVLIVAVHIAITFTSNRAGWSSIFWVFFAVFLAVTGLVDGMISFLFGRSELRALEEVAQEVQDAKKDVQSALSRGKV